jgi:Domain of unknown function (DUF3806)
MATILPLDGSEWAALREQVAKIQALVTRRFGAARFDETKNDIPVLQRIIFENLFDESQEDDWRSLASAFGNVVAKQLAFEWVADSDGMGTRQLALQLKITKALILQPHKLILDRVQRGEAIDLAALFDDFKGKVEKTKLLPKKFG